MKTYYTYLFECPQCGTLVKKPNVMDYRGDGEMKRYSDLSLNLGKYTLPTRITKCRNCDTVFWFRPENRHLLEDITDKSRLVSMNDFVFLDLEDYYRVIDNGLIEEKNDEVKIRRQIWWLYNDRVKLGKSLFNDKDDLIRWSLNLERLLALIDTSMAYGIVMVAEINRNLGAFDRCMDLINSIEGNDAIDFRRHLTEECERKNRWVVEVDFRCTKFRVEIRELLSQVVELSAPSAEEAVKIVKEMYRNKEIVLGKSDLLVTEIDEYEENYDYDENEE